MSDGAIKTIRCAINLRNWCRNVKTVLMGGLGGNGACGAPIATIWAARPNAAPGAAAARDTQGVVTFAG